MMTLFLFLLKLHVCHLLGCLFFYKINAIWFSVSHMYSGLELLKQFQSFSGKNFCNVSLLYLSLCLCLLFKPFTQTSDVRLTCEISWALKLLCSIPASGCDFVLSNFYKYLIYFLTCVYFFFPLRYCQWGCVLMALFLCRGSDRAKCRLLLSSVLISVLFTFFVPIWKTLLLVAGSFLFCFCMFMGFVLFCFKT